MRTHLHLSIGLVLLTTTAMGQAQVQAGDPFIERKAMLDEREATGYVSLVVRSANDLSDETLIVFDSGSPATDGEDVPKFSFSHPTAPRIATQGDGLVLLAINAYGPYTTEVSIPVMLRVATNGTYTLTMTGLNGVGLTCLTLEDPVQGVITPLHEGTTYTFDAFANADPGQARFVLHGTAPVPLERSEPSCAGSTDGFATVQLDAGPADVKWSTAGGQVLQEMLGVPSGLYFSPELNAGAYTVRLEGLSVCGALMATFELEEPMPLAQEVGIAQPDCAGDQATVTLAVSGGTEPYQYAWSNGTAEAQLVAPAGEYTVEVSDANGCTLPSIVVEVMDGTSPIIGGITHEEMVLVGEPVAMTSEAATELDHVWDFGDGMSSSDVAPEHTYTMPGTYTISLTVSDGSCESTLTSSITVGSTTAIAAVGAQPTRAWSSNGVIMLEHAFSNNMPVRVQVVNVAGQVVQDSRYPATPGRLTITRTPLTTGVWFVQVSNGQTLSTFRVPVTH